MQEKLTWVLFDKSTNKKTQPMDTMQTQMVIMTISVKNLENIFIWTKNWTQWKKLTEFLNSDQKHFAFKKSTPAKQANTDNEPTLTNTNIKEDETQSAIYFTDTVFTEINLSEDSSSKSQNSVYSDFNGDDLKLEDVLNAAPKAKISFTQKSSAERRESPRHNFKIEFLIATKTGKTFRSYTKNISLSGAMLEDPIPQEILSHPMDLVIINKFEKDPVKGKLHFRGKIIGNLADPARLNFINPEQSTIKKLQEMLESYLASKAEMQKSKKAV